MEPFIIDAHAHFGFPGTFFVPETGPEHLLALMDLLSIRVAIIAGDQVLLYEGVRASHVPLREACERSEGRLFYLGFFDPRAADASLAALEETARWPGFVGIKIHPSLHRTWADDPVYQKAWEFAADHDLPILTHSWSVSETNPAQAYSTPGRFEVHVRRFPQVRLVLGHAGGRGAGRLEAVRMVNEHPNVFLDIAGDVFCNRLIKTLAESVPPNKILFGTDFPWIDPRANLSRVLLAEIDDQLKQKILSDNACAVYKIEEKSC